MPTEIPGLPKVLMPLIFLCSIELICLICWLKIVMIIHVSFCTTCGKCGMWVIMFVVRTSWPWWVDLTPHQSGLCWSIHDNIRNDNIRQVLFPLLIQLQWVEKCRYHNWLILSIIKFCVFLLNLEQHRRKDNLIHKV